MKKTILLLSSIMAVSGCTMGDAEIRALKQGAIHDIRNRPKEAHLAYLQCYALDDVDKDNCQLRAQYSNELHERYGAASWEYVRPYDYEAERLGFAQFLRDHGRACKGVDQGPEFDSKAKAYNVICTDGNTYHMRFVYSDVQPHKERLGYKVGEWHIVE